jgi:hypothetical protein
MNRDELLQDPRVRPSGEPALRRVGVVTETVFRLALHLSRRTSRGLLSSRCPINRECLRWLICASYCTSS